MKTKFLIFIFFILLFFVQTVRGQVYLPVVKPDTSIWYLAHKQLAGNIMDTLFAKNKIGEYIEIWVRQQYGEGEDIYWGKIKSNPDNSKLWFVVSPDWFPYDTTEKLIYDISLTIGDTFTFSNYGNFTDTVEDVFYENNLKYIEFKNKNTNWNEKVRFIEGVGPNTGIIVAEYLGILDPYTVCKYERDSLFYVNQNDNFIGCTFNTSDIKSSNWMNHISISPNPFFHVLHINIIDSLIYQNDKIYIQITNTYGQVVHNSKSKNTNVLTINTWDFNPGFYLLSIITNKEVLTKKIIKL
ncbi:MAG: T9SS type A sorting domain-containing protein [Bacteroidia bacterium]|nr:T9SS type A sorting domain-containing protein [Bacteroidia bacterium]